jgi:hypothetical protein
MYLHLRDGRYHGYPNMSLHTLLSGVLSLLYIYVKADLDSLHRR